MFSTFAPVNYFDVFWQVAISAFYGNSSFTFVDDLTYFYDVTVFAILLFVMFSDFYAFTVFYVFCQAWISCVFFFWCFFMRALLMRSMIFYMSLLYLCFGGCMLPLFLYN